jgi:hypothetical protein
MKFWTVTLLVSLAPLWNPAFQEAHGLEERPRAILYIAAEPGCYSATYISSKTVPMKAPKKLYPVNCYQKHHYVVFWSGQMETQPGNPIPSSRKSANLCVEKGNKLTLLGRSESAYNFGLKETTGTGNWLADKGPEAKRYPKRVVCYMGLSTDEFRFFKEMSQPLIRGIG